MNYGRNSGSAGLWTGGGITSSAAASSGGVMGLAVVANERGDGTTVVPSIDGINLSTDSVLVLYTYAGDSDLDGSIGPADYFAIDRGRAQRKTGYVNGDFDYSGGIPNGDDYALIDRAFLRQSATGPAAPAAPVPEPTTMMSMVALIGGMMLRLRRGNTRPG